MVRLQNGSDDLDWQESVEDDERTERPIAATSEKEIDIIKE